MLSYPLLHNNLSLKHDSRSCQVKLNNIVISLINEYITAVQMHNNVTKLIIMSLLRLVSEHNAVTSPREKVINQVSSPFGRRELSPQRISRVTSHLTSHSSHKKKRNNHLTIPISTSKPGEIRFNQDNLLRPLHLILAKITR